MSAVVAVSETAASVVQSNTPPPNLGEYRSQDKPAEGEEQYLSKDNGVPVEIEVDGANQLLIDFDGPEDPSNPVNWSKGRKWAIVILLSALNVVTYAFLRTMLGAVLNWSAEL